MCLEYRGFFSLWIGLSNCRMCAVLIVHSECGECEKEDDENDAKTTMENDNEVKHKILRSNSKIAGHIKLDDMKIQICGI